MILTILDRWRAIWMHLARDPVGGIGFFLVMMGLLLSGDTTFCVYIFSLGIFLSFDRQRIAPAEEDDMAIPLFGLMLTLVSGGPFCGRHAVSGVHAAGWLRSVCRRLDLPPHDQFTRRCDASRRREARMTMIPLKQLTRFLRMELLPKGDADGRPLVSVGDRVARVIVGSIALAATSARNHRPNCDDQRRDHRL